MTDHVVAGTGSRSLKTADPDAKVQATCTAADQLSALRHEHGGRLVVMSGMAEGWDELLAVLALRAAVRLWCAVPTRSYGGYYWGRNSLTGRNRLTRFAAILSRAERVTYVMEDVHKARGLYLNGVHANFVRNTWMVVGHGAFSGADEFLVWDPTSRGTAHCLDQIRRAGKPYRILSEQPDTARSAT